MILRSLIALVLALSATAAEAEGGKRVFDCIGADGGAVQFVIAPRETDATGKGPIDVSYDGTVYAGVTSSDRGPFQFGTETDHYALLIEGPTADGKLKVTLHHATASKSDLIPFTCEIVS